MARTGIFTNRGIHGLKGLSCLSYTFVDMVMVLLHSTCLVDRDGAGAGRYRGPCELACWDIKSTQRANKQLQFYELGRGTEIGVESQG